MKYFVRRTIAVALILAAFGVLNARLEGNAMQADYPPTKFRLWESVTPGAPARLIVRTFGTWAEDACSRLILVKVERGRWVYRCRTGGF